jgi:hypothetical protein
MLYNITHLPTALWYVSYTDDVGYQHDSIWTTRREARGRKRELQQMGYTTRIAQQQVLLGVHTPDLHS